MYDNDYLHILLTGLSGVGKSVLAASGPTPQLVSLFDSIGNARKPYLENMRVKRTKDAVVLMGNRVSIIPTLLCYDKDDTDLTKLIRKVWCFNSGTDVENPVGKEQFNVKRAVLLKELESFDAQCFIFDSMTSWQVQTRHSVTNYANMKSADIANIVTNEYEDLCYLLQNLPVTTIAITHTSTQGVTTTDYNNKEKRKRVSVQTTAPGRMSDRIYVCFSDVWNCFVDVSDSGEAHYRVQTFNSGDTIAKNSIDAPAECDNNYAEITANRKEIIWVD